jgi:hypothetical protein
LSLRLFLIVTQIRWQTSSTEASLVEDVSLRLIETRRTLSRSRSRLKLKSAYALVAAAGIGRARALYQARLLRHTYPQHRTRRSSRQHRPSLHHSTYWQNRSRYDEPCDQLLLVPADVLRMLIMATTSYLPTPHLPCPGWILPLASLEPQLH